MIIKLIKSEQYEGVYYNPKLSGRHAIFPPLEEDFYYPEDNCYYVPDFIFEDGDLEKYDEETVRTTLNRKLKISNQIEDLKIILTPAEWDLLSKDIARNSKLFDQMSE